MVMVMIKMGNVLVMLGVIIHCITAHKMTIIKMTVIKW